MKRIIAIIALAGASIVAHAQWSGQAQTVDSYTWGTPVPPKPLKHRRPCPACGTTTVNPLNGHALNVVPGGAIDAQTGWMLPSAGDGHGYVDPYNGGRYIPAP
ncbi:hypothetical protein [Burkholderia sp. LMG 32019]|uniref:hypothetical protein n=1 Tax=Burkholderia sp. LMG 32019 TaxID=3158173 RepID=UPI003C2E5A07